jgi:hypothetical protein
MIKYNKKRSPYASKTLAINGAKAKSHPIEFE